MFKAIRKIFSLILPIIIGLVLAISIPLYFGAQKITNREVVRGWLLTPTVKEAYKGYAINQIINQDTYDLLSLFINAEDLQNSLKENIDDQWVEKSINANVDGIYNWLEGTKTETAKDNQSNNTNEKTVLDLESSVNDLLNSQITNSLGLDQVKNLPLLGNSINILNLNSTITDLIPTVYNQLVLLPNRLLILNGILLVLLLLSSDSIRKLLRKLGVVGLVFGIASLYGPTYLNNHPEAWSYIGINAKKLPDINKLPSVGKEIYKVAKSEIINASKTYVFIGFGAGIGMLVLSQLELKEVENWDWRHESSDEESEDEEE